MATIVSDWPALQREAYAKLTALPAETARSIALAQTEKVASRLADASAYSIHPRWSSYKADIAEAREHLAIGDSLKDATDEDSRKLRRRQYATAYLRSRLIGRNLDEELAEGGTLQILVSDFAKFSTEIAETAKEKAKEVLQTGTDIVTIAAVVGAVVLIGGLLKGDRRG